MIHGLRKGVLVHHGLRKGSLKGGLGSGLVFGSGSTSWSGLRRVAAHLEQAAARPAKQPAVVVSAVDPFIIVCEHRRH